jgi:chromosome segregation ATPase
LATLLNSLLDMLASSESNTANLQTAVVELENDLEVTRRALETEERGRREMESEVDEARRMMEVAEGVVEGLRVEREEAEGAVEQARVSYFSARLSLLVRF